MASGPRGGKGGGADPSGGVAARAPARDRRARGPRVREAVARGRCRRVRGDRLPRVLRPRRDRARRGAAAAPGSRRAQRHAVRAPRRDGGDRALELPARDSVRDDVGRARHRQRRGPQAGRAVAGMRADARPGPARRRGARVGASRCSPARATPARRWWPIPGVHTIAFTGSMPVGLEIARAAAERRARTAAHQARGVGARRQELRDRRLRRRPRRGGAGDRLLGVRVRRPEVLGGGAGARPRGDRRSADRAGGGRGQRARGRAGRSARDRRAAGDRTRRAGTGRSVRRDRPPSRAESRRGSRACPTHGWFCPPTVAVDLPARLARC